MKLYISQNLTRKIVLSIALSAFSLLGLSQKKQTFTDSLSNFLSTEFERGFTLDSSMTIGCQNSAIESYYGKTIPPVKGQAHFHSRIKLEDEPVLEVLKIGTILNTIKEGLYKNGSFEYLNEINASRFWVEEVQVEKTYYLVVGID
jgi:hypothetical protein